MSPPRRPPARTPRPDPIETHPMPYTPPTITPSGTTFAQFRAGGFRGQLERLAIANALPPAIRSLVLGPFAQIQAGITHAVDAYLQGGSRSRARTFCSVGS